VATRELCPNCGIPLASGTCLQCAERSSRIIHRDILLLVLLTAIAVVLFLFTRAMAAKEREMDARVAAAWFAKGEEQVRAGDMGNAIDSFRKSTNGDHENRTYVLALANALAAAGHSEEAHQALLRLRESSPENAEINLHLARLAAKRGDVAEALRYYHNALYGLWTGSETDQDPQEVRVELIHFLLDHHDHSRALSEVLILAAEIPEGNAAGQTEAGQLFAEAGDAQHALKHFVSAIALDRDDAAALAGAGEAAYKLADYPAANRYLEMALMKDHALESDQEILSITRMILSHDPMAAHLTRDERNRRVLVDFDQAGQRFQSCVSRHAGENNSTRSGLNTLQADVLAMQSKLQLKNLGRDPELVRDGVELISKIEETANTSCGNAAGLDEALLLIGRKYRGTMQ
jgi:tetratricopeptide (TPR) repeat protein